jgi:hypothetical protein
VTVSVTLALALIAGPAPAVRETFPGPDGKLAYGVNASIVTVNPDGTDLQLYYGANSHMTGTTADGQNNAVIEFVKPREMQDGRILTLARPYTDIDFGGDLLLINGNQFVENNQPLLADAGMVGRGNPPAGAHAHRGRLASGGS